jgi:hypothetical protein
MLFKAYHLMGLIAPSLHALNDTLRLITRSLKPISELAALLRGRIGHELPEINDQNTDITRVRIRGMRASTIAYVCSATGEMGPWETHELEIPLASRSTMR